MPIFNNRLPHALSSSPHYTPPIRLSAAAAVGASFGPFLSAGRQLVHLLPYSHPSKPPICAGAVRIHKAAAMTGLDSTPSLSSIPLHAHLTLLITCFSTRARNSSLESSRESSGALRCLAAISRCLEIRDDCLRVVSTCCTNHVCSAHPAVGTTDYLAFSWQGCCRCHLSPTHLPLPAPHLHIAVFRVLDPVSTYTSSLTRAPSHRRLTFTH
jgi:hypothetical protein